MIKTLRKRHFQVWIILAFLVPAGIVAGAVARHGIRQFAANKCSKHPVSHQAKNLKATIASPSQLQIKNP